MSAGGLLTQNKGILLLSGGLDSAVLLCKLLRAKYEVVPLMFDYGQKNVKELDYAKRLCRERGITDYHEVKLDLSFISDSPIVHGGKVEYNKVQNTVYINARNIIFLSIATGLAEKINARYVFIGTTMIGTKTLASVTPDSTGVFIDAFNVAVKYGTIKKPIIRAPYVYYGKKHIIKSAKYFGLEPVSYTHLTLPTTPYV